MGFLRVLGWIFIPFVMIFVSWKRLKGAGKTFGIIWAVFMALAFIGNLVGDSESQSTTAGVTQQDKAEKPKATKAPKATLAPVELSNEGVSSDVNITVNSFKTTDTIGDNQFAIATAQGVFKLVEITLTNGQKDAITIDSNSFTLVDDQKREFTHSASAQTALMSSVNKKKTPFFLTGLNPGLSMTGYIAFDVPADAKGFTLEARGGLTGKKITLKVE